MSSHAESGVEMRRQELEEKLRALNQQLHRELLARGFDPAQDDNLALTAPLAKLHMQRESLRAELESLATAEPVKLNGSNND